MNPYPEHTPPSPPKGMKWEYRGVGWYPEEKRTFYVVNHYGEVGETVTLTPFGIAYVHYFEAVTYRGSVEHQEMRDRIAAGNAVEEDILIEALRLTSSDRQNQYGPPDQDFARTAAMWSALFGDKMSAPFEARDVALAMICLKLSRETHKRKRDSAVDIAGYARCLHICNETSRKMNPNEDG